MGDESKSGFSVTPDLLLSLHKIAIQDIYSCAGTFRKVNVTIANTKHVPPEFNLVAGHVEEMCKYLNQNFGKSAIHLAAYAMWRHNWIHPFNGGNGRTSRALSYLLLNVRLGFRLPGENTIAQQIEKDRSGYYAALDKADDADRAGKLDVSAMEDLLAAQLAVQLLSVHNKAVGK
jgi:Fic family protein